MMRMAGRSDDGTAKALTTNDVGSLRTTNKSDSMKLFDKSFNVPQYGRGGITSEIHDARGYKTVKFEFVLSQPKKWRVVLNHYLFQESTGDYVKIGEDEVYSTLTSTQGFTLEANVNSFFSVTVYNHSEGGANVTPDSSYTLSQDLVPEKNVVVLKYDRAFVIPAGGTSDIVFNPNNCKEFMIHFRSDGRRNLNDIKISEYYNYIIRDNFPLKEDIIGSYQPLITSDANGIVYHGTTPMIPVMSPYEIGLRIKNNRPTDFTMSYSVVGYR